MSLDQKLRTNDCLSNAWKKVYENGLQSQSQITQSEVIKFKEKENTYLKTIKDQLRGERYSFKLARGVEIEKENGQLRPLVVPHLHDRIVHRALLDCLWQNPQVKSFLSSPRSFGGLPKRSVSMALKEAHEIIKSGCRHYCRADIKGFFTKIPKQIVLDKIFDLIDPDQSINILLKNATKVELENINRLKNRHLFPDQEIGAPQGSSLSPFFGNVLLKKFDEEMNSNKINCIRFIDDFLILCKTESKLQRAVKLAKRHLEKFGMEIYDPSENNSKAQKGKSKDGINFLGCILSEDSILPNQKTIDNLYQNIDIIVNAGIEQLKNFKKKNVRDNSLVSTLSQINFKLMGWGNHYKFCNARNLFEEIDNRISRRISPLLRIYFKTIGNTKNDIISQRRFLGVHLLNDSKKEPIIY